MGGIGNIYIRPASKVLYLGAASGTTVSHVSDIVGEVQTVHLALLQVDWFHVLLDCLPGFQTHWLCLLVFYLLTF